MSRSEAIEAAAEALREARYGVAVWAAAELDPLAIEMLVGLVKDLNETTRWAGLSIPKSITAAGATIASAWMTGFPLRSAFVRGRWEHDPWRFDARRMLGSGEADAAIYICSHERDPPDWLAAVPAVLLVNGHSAVSRPDAVRISIGMPARDHEAILYDRLSGGLVHQPASAGCNKPSVASTLNRIRERLAP
jgi:formylmethanofuran dehydrogenase subunit B